MNHDNNYKWYTNNGNDKRDYLNGQRKVLILHTQDSVNFIWKNQTLKTAKCYTILNPTSFKDDLIEKVGDDEKPYSNNCACQVTVRRSAAVSELWNITNHFNTLNRG